MQMAAQQDGQGTPFAANFRSDKRMPRKYFQIPKDQQELLSRPEAWNLRGPPNIPRKVLEELQETARRAAQQRKPRNVTLPSGPGASSAPIDSVKLPRSQMLEQEHDEDDREEDDASRLSWSLSPQTHQLPALRAPLVEPSPVPTPTPIYGHPPSSPPPARPQGRSGPRTRYQARLANQAPPSSAESEPEMDYQPPRAITDRVPDPINRVLRTARAPGLAPTSAQIIPSTTESSPRRPNSMEEPPKKRRKFIMKPLEFNDSPERRTPHVVNETIYAPRSSIPAKSPKERGMPSLRQPVGQAILVMGSDDDSSDDDSIPPTGLPTTRPSSRRPTRHSSESTRGEAIQDIVVSGTSVNQREPTPKGAGTSFSEQVQTSSNSDAVPPNGPPSQAPFTAFCVAYPDFTGSLGDFVRAVITIEVLQQKRQLMEFLYDDFIRVFSTSYVNYVSSVAADGQLLTAIAWYNEYVPAPLYTKKVMGRANLHDVKTAYPEKYNSCRPKPQVDRNSSGSGGLASTSPPAPTVEDSLMEPDQERPLPQPVREAKPIAEAALPKPRYNLVRNNTRDSSIPQSRSPSTGGLPPHVHSGTVEAIERLETTQGYVMILSQPRDSGSSQAQPNDAPTAAVQFDIPLKKEDMDVVMGEAETSLEETSHPSLRFETQAFESQILDSTQSQPESIVEEPMAQLPVAGTARVVSQFFEAQIGHASQTESDPHLVETQPPLTQPPELLTSSIEEQIIEFTQPQVASTQSETQRFEAAARPPSTARTHDIDVTRIPETAIKPKKPQHIRLRTQRPASTALREAGNDASRLSVQAMQMHATDSAKPRNDNVNTRPQPAGLSANGRALSTSIERKEPLTEEVAAKAAPKPPLKPESKTTDGILTLKYGKRRSHDVSPGKATNGGQEQRPQPASEVSNAGPLSPLIPNRMEKATVGPLSASVPKRTTTAAKSSATRPRSESTNRPPAASASALKRNTITAAAPDSSSSINGLPPSSASLLTRTATGTPQASSSGTRSEATSKPPPSSKGHPMLDKFRARFKGNTAPLAQQVPDVPAPRSVSRDLVSHVEVAPVKTEPTTIRPPPSSAPLGLQRFRDQLNSINVPAVASRPVQPAARIIQPDPAFASVPKRGSESSSLNRQSHTAPPAKTPTPSAGSVPKRTSTSLISSNAKTPIFIEDSDSSDDEFERARTPNARPTVSKNGLVPGHRSSSAARQKNREASTAMPPPSSVVPGLERTSKPATPPIFKPQSSRPSNRAASRSSISDGSLAGQSPTSALSEKARGKLPAPSSSRTNGSVPSAVHKPTPPFFKPPPPASRKNASGEDHPYFITLNGKQVLIRPPSQIAADKAAGRLPPSFIPYIIRSGPPNNSSPRTSVISSGLSGAEGSTPAGAPSSSSGPKKEKTEEERFREHVRKVMAKKAKLEKLEELRGRQKS